MAVDAEVTVILREAHDAVVGNVAKQNISPSWKVDRTFGPAEPGRDALDLHGAGEGRKACRPERNLRLLHRFQARVRIAGAGKRAERQGGRCRRWGAGLAARGGGRGRK